MPGGVANYYKTLRPYLDEQNVYFEIGGIPGESGRWRVLRRLLADNWNFHRLLSRQHFDLVHINPSMDPYSLLRDGLLLLLARLHRRPVLVFYRGWFPHVAAHVRKHHARLFRLVYSQAHTNIVLAAEFRSALSELGVSPPTFVETAWSMMPCSPMMPRRERQPQCHAQGAGNAGSFIWRDSIPARACLKPSRPSQGCSSAIRRSA